MNMQSLCEAAERLGYKPRVSSYAQAGTASFLIAEDQEQKAASDCRRGAIWFPGEGRVI